MRIASYNVENMFRRPKALFDPKTKKANRGVLDAYAALTRLLEQESYEGDREEILERLRELGLERADENEFAVLRKIRGRLLRRPRDSGEPVEVVAEGRGDWVGWVELKKEVIDAEATRNTAAVMAEVDPDVLAVIEVEDRPTLERFNEYVLKPVTDKAGAAWTFGHAMLIDGNDERGIDVGVLSKDGFPIGRMRSHVNEEEKGSPVFSRDCAEYEVPTPDGGSLLLMVNHFKSKMGGGEERRKLQAERVAKIYGERRKEGWDRIVIAGDLNDTPKSEPLEPLLAKTDLKDAGAHKGFAWGERNGTFETGNDQFDYLLLSPALSQRFQAGGVNRKGIWHGSKVKNPWAMLPTLTKEDQAASDHAAIWVELDL
jgi:endonuclease/exonuclease/phosphatase family metal-dependent hydrolase